MSDLVRAFAELGSGHALLLVLLVGCAMRVTFLSTNRVLRTVKVLCRGWPPAHLDADGDWKPEPEKSEAA